MKYHLVGIGGIGMSGLAKLLLEQNQTVSGSDLNHNSIIERLKELGAEITLKQDGKNIKQEMTVVISSSIKKDNLEYQSAVQNKCPIIHRSELLRDLAKEKRSLCVTGTHGKTTVSSLLSWVLFHAKVDPSFAVGGIIAHLQTNARAGLGDYFVIEADESDGTHVNYNVESAIITNLGTDHLDHYGTLENLETNMLQFAGKVKRALFWCGEDTHLQKLSLKGTSYGFTEGCELKGSRFLQNGWQIQFDAEYQGRKYENLTLPMIGKHSALNALAVFGLSLACGIEVEKIKSAFATFPGVSRRCQKIREDGTILWLDDYAHHPTEIRSTLKGIREAISERRLVAIFEPHRYSRMKECMGSFKEVFSAADLSIVTDIYPAGEAPIQGVNGTAIAKESNSLFLPRNTLADALNSYLQPHDVVVTLGAGSITYLHNECAHLTEKKLCVGVLSGGYSPEHEISEISAKNVISQMSKYDAVQIHVPKEGIKGAQFFEKLQKCDLIFPLLHGQYGEDGTMQGVLEILDIPYVGNSTLASALAMNKAKTKQILAANQVPIAPFVTMKSPTDPMHLRFPLFVKAPNFGSSVGVYRVDNETALKSAIEEVLKIDTFALVEEEVEGRELEFAVLGNDHIHCFGPGEIGTRPGMPYLLNVKYGEHSLRTSPKADLTEDEIKRGKELAAFVYECIGCEGLCRVDMFLDKNGVFIVNELNTIPGFTPTSLFPKICESDGISFSQLIDKLVILALHKHRMAKKRRNAQEKIKIPI
ncbi:MAG: UDP-N-acetylmuramate--L-alanine ligase [Waddliaceae bacterium]